MWHHGLRPGALTVCLVAVSELLVCCVKDPRFQREFYSTVNTLLLSSHQQQKPSMDRQKYNSQRDPESAINILADHKIAEAEMANQQHRQEATQKEVLERKLTERSAKREAQVRLGAQRQCI